jgi:cytochrome c-type biogenesis protein CcsB
MGIDRTLGDYGDLLFGSALAVYVLAMILHAVEHGLMRQPAPRQRVVEPAATPVAVGGADAADPTHVTDTLLPADPEAPGGPDGPDGPARRPLAERCGRIGVALTVLGAALHLAMLLLRGVAAGRPPWGNMYEFVAAVCFFGVAAWLVVLYRRPELRPLGTFLLLPVIALMFLGVTVLYTETAPIMPQLRSYWLAIHVTAATLSSGILLFAGVASALYPFRAAHESRGRFAWADRLPGADVLDRVAYRATALAFPIWTFAVITGAIWAEAAWSRYWGWDPKETTAFIAWIVYAGYLHARSTAGWRGQRAAAVNVVGLAVMIFNLFFVNLVVPGLHSYAGVG